MNSEDDIATTFISKRNTILTKSIEVDLLFGFLELQTLMFGRSLPPNVNLLGRDQSNSLFRNWIFLTSALDARIDSFAIRTDLILARTRLQLNRFPLGENWINDMQGLRSSADKSHLILIFHWLYFRQPHQQLARLISRMDVPPAHYFGQAALHISL